MGRWEPDARGRMARAALELYAERGYEQTTAADIADRAGVTERTFFRHFADKREVLFDGSSQLQAAVVASIAEADGGAPLDVACGAFVAAAPILEERRDHARRRAAVIAAHTSLQERELLKMSTLASAAASALQERGVGAPEAQVAAQTAVGLFGIGFERWVAADDGTSLAEQITRALADLRQLAGSPTTSG